MAGLLDKCQYLIAFAIVLVVAIAAMVFCRKLEKKKKKIIRGEATIAIIVTLCIVVNLILTGPVYTMVNLVLGDNNGTISEESIESATELNVELAEEGIALLKNEDSALPLEPSNRELELIDRVATTFDNVIVIINSSNMMELGWVDDYDSIQSVILCPRAGRLRSAEHRPPG